MNVNERQLISTRHASAQSSRVSGDCGVLLYSSRPSSAQVSFARESGLGVADVQAVGKVGFEIDVVRVGQLMWDSVTVVMLVCFVVTVVKMVVVVTSFTRVKVLVDCKLAVPGMALYHLC